MPFLVADCTVPLSGSFCPELDSYSAGRADGGNYSRFLGAHRTRRVEWLAAQPQLSAGTRSYAGWALRGEPLTPSLSGGENDWEDLKHVR